LAGTESGLHVVLQIRMIVWEWLNRMLPGLETESGPHAVLWQIRMIVWEWLNWMLPGLETESDLILTEKGNLLGVFQPNAFLSDMQGESTYRNTFPSQ
jgi:hypothetical protein